MRFVKKLKNLLNLKLQNMPKIIWYLIITGLVISVTRFMSMPFLAVYFKNNLGFTSAKVGFLLGVTPFTSMIFSIIGGRLSDILGSKRTYILSLILSSICLISFILFSSYLILILVAAVSGIAWSLYNTSNQTLLSEYTSDKTVSNVFSYNYWVINLGGVVGPLLGVYLLNMSIILPFLIFSIVLILICIFYIFIFKSNLLKFQYLKEMKNKQKLVLFNKQTLHIITKDQILIFIALGYFSLYFLESQIESNIVQYMDSFVHEGLTIYGNMLSISMFIIIVFQPIVTKALNKVGSKKLIAISSLLYFTGPILFMTSKLPISFYAGIILITFGEMILAPKLQALVASIPKNEMKSTYFSIFNMGGNLAYFVGPWFGGIIYSYAGITPIFLLMSIVAVMGGLFIYKANNKLANFKIQNKNSLEV